MKSWKAVAGTLALFVGVRGAAFGQDWAHRDQDWGNNGGYQYRVDDRGNYQRAYTYGYQNYGYNNYHGRDGDHDRDDRGDWNRKHRDRDRDRVRDRDNDRGYRDRR